jgi:hypothetical protein
VSPSSSPASVSSPSSTASPSVGSSSNQNTNSAAPGGLSPGVSALIAILVLGAIGGIGGFLYYRRAKGKNNINTISFSTSSSTMKNNP